MKNNKSYLFNNKFFLNFFILLAILKTAYIALVSQYFELVSTPIAIKVRLFIILLGIILFFCQKNKSFHKIFFYILFLFITSFFVIIFQLQFDPSIYINEKKFYFFGIASSITVFVTVVYVCYEKLVNLNSYIFYLLVLFSISSLLTGSDEIHSRFQLKFLDPISVGYFAGILVLLSVWRFYYLNNKKLVSFIGIIIGSLLLFEANSKSPIFGVLFGIFLLLYPMKNGKVFIIFILFFALFFLTFFLDNLVNYRFFYYQDPGISIRLTMYQEYIREISNNIILPSMHPTMNLLFAHNMFLSIYSGTGIIGFIVFIYLVIFTLINSFKLVYYKSCYGWIGLIFVLTFTKSLVSGAILDEVFWYFLVLTNVYFLKHKKENMR